MRSAPPDQPKWFHFGWPVAMPLGLAALALLVAVLVVPLPGPWIQKAPFILAHLVVAAWAGFQLSRLGAHMTPEALTLVRPFTTKVFGWTRVRRFTLERRPTGGLMARVILEDGSKLWVIGVGSWSRFASTSSGAETVVEEMNALLVQYRADESTTKEPPY